MSWLYLRALVEAYLEDTCLDGEQSAPLNGSNIQLAFLQPDKMTDFSRLSRFGMTFKPLTENLGEELLMLYLEDFRAKTYPQQEKAQELTGNDQECGKRWHGLLAKYDQVSCSWKTPQCSLLEDSEVYSETWPRWGMTRNGESFLRQIPALRTCESESGLSEQIPNNEDFFHTPNCNGLDGGSNSRKALKKRMEQNWPTPLATDWKRRGPASKQQGLPEMVRMWPTPTCNMVSGGPNHNSPQVLAGKHGINLKGAVMKWPTPQASDNRDRGHLGSGAVKRRMEKGKQIGLSQCVSTESGQLNPTWVEWLMGWPLGWTDLKPLETDRFLEWQQQHLNY